jgi:hypothetical protein
MATAEQALPWAYTRDNGRSPDVVLLLDDSVASAVISAEFRKRGIDCRVSRVSGIEDDRPAVYVAGEGPASGKMFYGPAEISFYFLTRYESPVGNRAGTVSLRKAGRFLKSLIEQRRDALT